MPSKVPKFCSHMILWAPYSESSLSQCRIDTVEEIIACCESSDEKDVLLGEVVRQNLKSRLRTPTNLLTDILPHAVLCWLTTAWMMHWIEGLKNLATSVLCIDCKPDD